MRAQYGLTWRGLTQYLAFGGLLTSIACGGSGGGGGGDPITPIPTPTPTVTGVTVASGTTITVGQTAQFTATANLSNSTQQNVSASAAWTSSNTAIATVSSAGLATGVAAGNAEIRAAHQGFTGSAALQVNAPAPVGPVARFTVNGPGGATNLCRFIVGSGGDFDCSFDGSASTGGTGGAINRWTWRFDIGSFGSLPVNTTTPDFKPANLCNSLNGETLPAQIGNTGQTQMIVKLVVRNAAGTDSAELRNSNVILIPQKECGFGF